MNILIVDRYKENIRFLKDILMEALDVDVFGVYDDDIVEASLQGNKTAYVEIPYDNDYDLAIIDYKEIDNVDFGKVPTIIVSPNTHVDVEVDSLERGAVDFVTKPISPPILIARINEVIKNP